jgi:hypothetical protein
MQVYALIQKSDSQAIDVFLSKEDAERALADCLGDEPDWVDLLGIEAVDLDVTLSVN